MVDVIIVSNKKVNLDNEDSDSDVIEDSDETTTFIASKHLKVTSSS